MPTVSGPQHSLMEGIAHGSIKPGNGKPSLAVAKEFAAADAARAHKRKKATRKMYPSARDTNDEGT